MGGLLPAPGKAVGALLAFPIEPGWPVGLDPRRRFGLLHTPGWRLLLVFQLLDPRFQCPHIAEELLDKVNQLLAGGSVQVHGHLHVYSLPDTPTAPFVILTQFCPSLNSYFRCLVDWFSQYWLFLVGHVVVMGFSLSWSILLHAGQVLLLRGPCRVAFWGQVDGGSGGRSGYDLVSADGASYAADDGVSLGHLFLADDAVAVAAGVGFKFHGCFSRRHGLRGLVPGVRRRAVGGASCYGGGSGGRGRRRVRPRPMCSGRRDLWRGRGCAGVSTAAGRQHPGAGRF